MALTRLYRRIAVIFILLAVLMGKSLSQARRVKEATVVATVKEFTVDGINGVNLNKEISGPTSKLSKAQISVETEDSRGASTKTRNMTKSTRKMRLRFSKKLVSSSSSSSLAAVHNFSRNNKGDNAKDNFMDFSVDYHSPKQHPPRNN